MGDADALPPRRGHAALRRGSAVACGARSRRTPTRSRPSLHGDRGETPAGGITTTIADPARAPGPPIAEHHETAPGGAPSRPDRSRPRRRRHRQRGVRHRHLARPYTYGAPSQAPSEAPWWTATPAQRPPAAAPSGSPRARQPSGAGSGAGIRSLDHPLRAAEPTPGRATGSGATGLRATCGEPPNSRPPSRPEHESPARVPRRRPTGSRGSSWVSCRSSPSWARSRRCP